MSEASYTDSDRQRWVREDPAHKRADRDDFARDRGRIIHAAALRRLSAKTQVMEPGSDDFVRNRLTHSLEVAQIGRELGMGLGCAADVVDSACLAHDLGHPPFGHNGEAALDAAAADIGGFEGNAQSFRLLTRLETKRFHPDGRSAGLNLTRATLDAACKYPWIAGHAAYPTRKYGVYPEDADAFAWVRQTLPDAARVCLEAQVMDWADDIAYAVHDIEDAVAGGRIDLRVLTSPTEMAAVFDVARDWYVPHLDDGVLGAATQRLLRSGHIPIGFDSSRRALAALKDMTSALIGSFAQAAEEATRARYGGGDLVRHNARLVIPEDTRAENAVLKALAAHYVMLAPSRVARHEDEHRVVHTLVDAYLARPEERLDPAYLDDFRAAADESAAKRCVVDQVAALTDHRAVHLARLWS